MARDNIDKQGPGRPHDELPERLRERQEEPHVTGARRYGTDNGTDLIGRRKAPEGPHETFPGWPTSRPLSSARSTRQTPPVTLDEPPGEGQEDAPGDRRRRRL